MPSFCVEEEMRRIETRDVFACARLIKKANVKEELMLIAEKAKEGNVNNRELGVELVFGVLGGLSEIGAEKSAYEFLSGPLEMDADEIAKLKPLDLITLLKELGKTEDKDGWKDFFQLLQGLMK